MALEGVPWSNQSDPARKQLTGMKVMVRTIKCTAVDYGSMPPGLRRALAVPQRQPLAGEFRGGAATPEAGSWPNPSAPVRKQLTGMKVLVRAIKRTAAELVGMPVGLRRGLAVPQRQPLAGEFRGGCGDARGRLLAEPERPREKGVVPLEGIG